jgi:hypothetical protein
MQKLNAKLDKNYRLTKAQINEFWKRFNYWADLWGVNKTWRIFTNETEDGTYYAQVATSFEEGLALVNLSVIWEIEPNSYLIDQTAFHESLHLLLAPLDEKNKNIAREHSVIRTLENTIFPMLYKK